MDISPTDRPGYRHDKLDQANVDEIAYLLTCVPSLVFPYLLYLMAQQINGSIHSVLLGICEYLYWLPI